MNTPSGVEGERERIADLEEADVFDLGDVVVPDLIDEVGEGDASLLIEDALDVSLQEEWDLGI